MNQKTVGFVFRIDAEDLDLHPLQLQAIGRGATLAECLGDALYRWSKKQPELAKRFTLETPIEAGQPPPGVS